MEEKLKHLSIEKKLRYGFTSILITTAIIFVAAIASLTTVLVQFRSFYTTAYQNDVLQMEIRKDLQVVGKMVLWSLTIDDAAITTEKLDLADQYADNIAANIDALEKSYHNKTILAELNSAVADLKASRTDLMVLARANKNEEALEIFNSTYNDLTENVQNILIKIGNNSSATAAKEYTLSLVVGLCSTFAVVIIFIIALIISTRIRKAIVRIIVQPVEQLEAAAAKLRKGELDVDITYTSEDEFGSLANNLNESCHALHAIVSDAGYILTEMSNGNFNIATKIEDQYVGEFVSLITAMRKLNRQLNETLRSINTASDQVAIGSSQLAESAQSLAEGATEQAGAIEELTATIENVTNTASNTAKSAESAATMAKEAQDNAAKSQADLAELTEAMQRISETSLEIQNIIGDIEDIASQTNLLSLNASIEAARAGDAGRGFGVVADQIGKLADDSAKSAVNTRELIAKAIQEVENGNSITKKTVTILNDILESMKFFASAAEASNEDSKNMARMLDEIEKAIEQISEVVQSNSASAEETSATSEELSAQSETLKELVSKFQLREE